MDKYYVTAEQVQGEIASVDYFPAENKTGPQVVVCAIATVTGFTVVGESVTRDSTAATQEEAKKRAYKKALNKLEMYLMFENHKKWYYATQTTPQERVAAELADLDAKRDKLATYLEKIVGEESTHNTLLRKQAEQMAAYAMTLQERLVEFSKSWHETSK